MKELIVAMVKRFLTVGIAMVFMMTFNGTYAMDIVPKSGKSQEEIQAIYDEHVELLVGQLRARIDADTGSVKKPKEKKSARLIRCSGCGLVCEPAVPEWVTLGDDKKAKRLGHDTVIRPSASRSLLLNMLLVANVAAHK